MIDVPGSPRNVLSNSTVASQGAQDFGKLVSSSGDNGSRVHDSGRAHFAREPIGEDLAGLKKFKVGLVQKSALKVNGRPTAVRFKGFGFEKGTKGTLNDKPLALYQKGSFRNPFAPVYRIDLEREQKGLEHFKGYPLSVAAEIQHPFRPNDPESYRVLNEPYLFEQNTLVDSNFHTLWRKVRTSRTPKEILQRNPEALKERVTWNLSRGRVQRAEAYYHAYAVRGVDLDHVKGLVQQESGKKYPPKCVVVPGRVDTDSIKKLSSLCVWVQDGDPGPVSVYKKWQYWLAPKAEARIR